MSLRFPQLRTSVALLTVSVLLMGGSGCQGTAARTRQTAAANSPIVPPDPGAIDGASTPVPPLTGIRQTVVDVESQQRAAPGTTAVRTVAGERTPAPPATAGDLPPEPENSTPVPPSSRMISTTSETSVLQTAEEDSPCVPVPSAWMGQMQSQNAALLRRIESLEAQLKITQENLKQVNGALETSRAETRQLEQELTRWKSQVRELEETLVRQQEEDLRSLNELAGALNQIVSDGSESGGGQ